MTAKSQGATWAPPTQFGMDEAAQLPDLELAEALWDMSFAVADGHNETAMHVIPILIGEALERWAPDVELAIAIEKQMARGQPSDLIGERTPIPPRGLRGAASPASSGQERSLMPVRRLPTAEERLERQLLGLLRIADELEQRVNALENKDASPQRSALSLVPEVEVKTPQPF